MALIKRDQVTPPTLRTETVTVEPLGGDVIVRELTFTERLTLREVVDKDDQNTNSMLRLLHLSVVDADGAHVFTPEQWNVFGGKHKAEAEKLFLKAVNVSGFDGEAAKKN